MVLEAEIIIIKEKNQDKVINKKDYRISLINLLTKLKPNKKIPLLSPEYRFERKDRNSTCVCIYRNR